jgi:hypothetical protein
MAEIVNLRRARKAVVRREKEAEAAANRAKYGLTKGERARKNAEAEKLVRALDARRLDEPKAES